MTKFFRDSAAFLIFIFIVSGCGGTSNGLTPVPAPTLQSITVSPDAPGVAPGTTIQLQAIGSYSNGSNSDLTASVSWSTDNTNVVTVSDTAASKGLVTAGNTGTANITATFKDVSGSTVLTVANVDTISVTPSSVTIAPSTTQQFAAVGHLAGGFDQDLTSFADWQSTPVMTFPSQGLVQAPGSEIGSATVSAAFGTVTGSADLTVAEPVSLSISPASVSIPKGTTQKFTATGNFSNGTGQDLTIFVAWDSTDHAIATINSSGVASAVQKGSATITADFRTVPQGTAVLNVTDASLSSISVSPSNPEIAMGATRQFTATGTFSDSASKDITTLVTWSSSNTNVATISNQPGLNGLATAVSTGTATISASLDGKSGSTNVTVSDARTCNSIKSADPSAMDGIFTIDPDGTGGVPPFQVYCDMSSAGGGWTLWANMNMDGTESTGLIDSGSSNNSHMDGTRYAALYSVSTQFIGTDFFRGQSGFPEQARAFV